MSLPPTKVYIHEFSSATLFAGDVQGTRVADDGLGDPQQDDYNASESSGVHLLVMDNPTRATTLRLPTRQLQASVSGKFVFDRGIDGIEAVIRYTVRPIMFRLQITPFDYDFPYSQIAKNSINICAGGAADASTSGIDHHSANLFITPYYDYGVDQYHIDNDANPQLTPSVKPVITVGSSGQGAGTGPAIPKSPSIIYGFAGVSAWTFRSGNIIQNSQVQLDSGDDNADAKVTVGQKWADPSSPFIYNSSFTYDTPTEISFHPILSDDGLPIKGHKLDFKVTKCVYRVWDASIGNFKDMTTTDPDLIAAAATFSPATGVTDNGDATGGYRSQLTAHKTDKSVSAIYFDVEDEDVFRLY